MGQTRHILSVNLEDYFQVAPLAAHVSESYWNRFALRVEANTLATLDLLDEHDASATFFVNGWISEQCPDLIAEVARRGHEIASKGYLHRHPADMTLPEFRKDFDRARDVIETAANRAVIGYRCAHGTFPENADGFYKALGAGGALYDSSVRPFGPAYRTRPEKRRIHEVRGAGWSVTEVPLSSTTLFGVPVPMTGGNYLRQVPDGLYDSRLKAFMRAGDMPWHLYFHVWEFDADQPRISAIPYRQRLRQYRNLDTMRDRLSRYLGAYDFAPIGETLGLVQGEAEAPAVQAAPVSINTEQAVPDGPRTPVTVVVPCYNEEASLPYLDRTLAALRERAPHYAFSYVFVDDCSRDTTWEVLNTLFGARDDCILVQHEQNGGVAAATMTGIRAARTEIVVGIDCDCSFDPNRMIEMIPLLTPGVDMVQASPYHPDGGVMNVPGWRLALSRNLSRIYRRLLAHRFHSYTACFRVYRRSAIADLPVENGGFLGIAEMFIRLDQAGSKIIEFPAVLESRLLGVSKMKTVPVIVEHVGMIGDLIFKRDQFRPPTKPKSTLVEKESR